MSVAIVSLLGFVLSAVGIVSAKRAERALVTVVPPGAVKPGTAWAVFLALLQGFLAAYAALGYVQDDPVSAVVANASLCLLVAASMKRPAIVERIREFTGPLGRFPHPGVALVALLFLAGLFAGLALEVPSNHDFTWTYPLCMLLEWALVTALLAGLFFLFQRRSGPATALVIGLFVLGMAEYFVIGFRSMPITPSDLTALSTAAAVSTGYTYYVTAYCLYAFVFMCVSVLCLQLASAFRPPKGGRTRRGLVVNLVVGALCIAGVVGHVTLIDYYNTLQITVYTWRPLESYYRQGFIPTFVSEAQTFTPPKPTGYSVEGAEELVESYSDGYEESAEDDEEREEAEGQFEEDSPTVIVVMNETFCDLSDLEEMHAGYEGPTYFKSIDDAVQRGSLYVSALGGGTANTEFEFLTGSSMAYLGSGMYPYTTYDLTGVENLARQFDDLGYTSIAMHPNHASNWNRENAYEDLGFEEFLDIDDFEDAETLRDMVTDKATYDKILELLEEDDDPQFIFDVTMQNHSGYDTGLIPYYLQENLYIDGQTDPEVNEFVSLIEQSDEALEYFVGELEDLDREVILVFFGDHQPYFSTNYNDRWFTDEDEAVHSERIWQTDYVIWANYDVAGRTQESEEEDLSCNYLGAELMELIGAPLTDYQKATLEAEETLPLLNVTGFQDSDGAWYLKGADVGEDSTESAREAEETRVDLWEMQYLQLFGDGKSVYTKHFQDEANETDPNLDPGTTLIK